MPCQYLGYYHKQMPFYHLSSTWYYAKACFKSSIKSSASSMPTLKRINESTTPVFSRSSLGIDACVMLAGCPQSDSTPPNDSANENILNLESTLCAASSLSSFNVNDIIPPKPFICFLATSWLGWVG